MSAPITSTPAADNHADAKPPRGLQWPALVIGLLLLNIGVCAVTVIAATANPARIEPDYYNKGLEWDKHRAAETQPAAAANTDTTDTEAATKD